MIFSNPTNAARADWARAAVEAFRDVCWGDPLDSEDGMKDAIGDLIADLLHLARQHGIDPEAMLTNGRMHFTAEEYEESTVACRKCGAVVPAYEAVMDEGEYKSEEEGNTFAYCSVECREAH